jgi:hypothetical protein
MDNAGVARCAANALVVLSDPYPRSVAAYYWRMAEPWLSAVAREFAECGDLKLASAAADLQREPANMAAYWSLCDLLAKKLGDGAARTARITDAVHEADNRSRLGYHLGPDYPPRKSETPPVAETSPAPVDTRCPAVGCEADVQVVIPFRDRSKTGTRARNLLACLHALRDQTLPRSRYHVVVVESDAEPRWEAQVSELADEYIFAVKHGMFNKCWTVNVGVIHASVRADVLCLLDADALLDRAFLARNHARFSYPGAGALLPFRDVFYGDVTTSSWIVGRRYRGDISRADLACMRGFLVRRSPGMCAWMRRDVFDMINGLDERYEGWGGEDLDLVLRLHRAAPMHFFDDPMIHMHHPVSLESAAENGESRNASIPLLSWPQDEPIGQIDKFRGGDPA